MSITYKSQGAGVSTEASGIALSPACPAVVDAGDILIIHAYYEGTTTAPNTPAGFTLLHGPEDVGSAPAVGRHWIFGKVAAGTEDGAANALGSPAVTTMRAARCYSFAGRVSGNIDQLVVGFSSTTHATDPQMPTVSTTKAGALAVACVAQNDNNALVSATGETGGDWTEAVVEYTAALTPGLVLGIQTCTPTGDPGTVSGGSISTANDPCGVIGFEIRDAVPVITVSSPAATHTYTSQQPQVKNQSSVVAGVIVHTYSSATPKFVHGIGVPALSHTYTSRVPSFFQSAPIPVIVMPPYKPAGWRK